jgi:hypothetical protein
MVGWGSASTRFAAAWALALGGSAVSAQAQPAAQPGAQPAQAAPVQVSVPDQLTVLRLVYSSIAALDHANQTGNYSVLRDLGAPGFQARNTSATLGTIFQAFRNQNVDLSYALILSPNFEFGPAIVQGGLLRIRGSFPFRPQAIGFDFLFQNVAGQWRLFGVAVAPIVVQQQQSAPPRR